MSMSGRRRLELERARREELRVEQVRRACAAMFKVCDEAMRSVRDVAAQQLAADDLRAAASILRELGHRLSAEPDAVRVELGTVSRHIHTAIASAESRARRWTDEQTQAVVAARVTRDQAASSARADSGLAGEHEQARSFASEAVSAAESGELGVAARYQGDAVEASAAASAAAMDERIRREVVKGLLRTLQEMGFRTVGPKLDESIVVLEGRLASGRRARFEVKLDGTMEFDLDGYEDRACAVDMEKVETAMRDRFGVRLGPPQVVWKNPDRISAGSRDLPGGQTRRKN